MLLAVVALKVVTDTLSYRQHRADAMADAADLAAERLVRGPRRVRAGHRRLCGARVWLLARGDIDRLNHDFQPKSAKEEVKEELDNFAQRSGAQQSESSGRRIQVHTRKAA